MTEFFYQLRRLFYLSVLSQQMGIDYKPCREHKVISALYIASIFHVYTSVTLCGPGSPIGIATDYGVDGPGSIPERRGFPPVQAGPGAHPASCKMGTGSFPGVKCGRGVLLTTHPLLVSRSWKSRTIPIPTLWATTGL